MEITDAMVERALHGHYSQTRADYKIPPMSADELKATRQSNGQWDAEFRRMKAALVAALSNNGA